MVPSALEIPFINFDITELILTIGYVGLFAIIFAESGLFFGFFLPGDSLLLTAGLLTVRHPEELQLWLVVVVCFVAAVSGDAVGYYFGHRLGGRLWERPDSRFFKRKHLLAAHDFYEQHGGKTIVIARFLPFVRTFAPIVAGAARMRYRQFAIFNFTGALLWAVGLPIAGHLLGQSIPPEVLDRYLLVIIAAVVLVSVLPTVGHLAYTNRAEIRARIRSRGREGAQAATVPVAGPDDQQG